MFSGFPVIPSTNIHHNFPLCLLCKNSSKNLLSGSLMQASPCNDQDEQGKPRHMKNLLGGLAASINAGRPANSVCEQWERSSTKTSCRSERLRGREGGRDLGRNVQASSRRDNTLCLPWDQNREGLVSRGTQIHQISAETLSWGHLWFSCSADTDFNSCFNNGTKLSVKTS